jgi:type I restriction enzyme R subunit
MSGIIMKSVNFELLRDKWPELASLGGFAEQYAWPDAESALVKLRSFIKAMIHRFYDENNLSVTKIKHTVKVNIKQ